MKLLKWNWSTQKSVIVQIKKNWIPAVLFLRAEKQLLELELLESQLVELEQAVGIFVSTSFLSSRTSTNWPRLVIITIFGRVEFSIVFFPGNISSSLKTVNKKIV